MVLWAGTTYSNGFIDHYKKMDEEDDKNGRGKVVTIKAWVKMRDFVNRMKKIAPSQTVKVDGVLLDNDLDNKLNAEALLRKEFENFDPVMDLMEVSIVDSVRPEVQSSQDGAVVLRYVYEIKYSKEKYYKKFVPRVNQLFGQISDVKPVDKSVSFKVAKVNLCPINGANDEEWAKWSLVGFSLQDSTGWSQSLTRRLRPAAVQRINRGGIATIREWSLSEHLWKVYHECLSRAGVRLTGGGYSVCFAGEEEEDVNCVFSLLDKGNNMLSQSVQKIARRKIVLGKVGGAFVPLMPTRYYDDFEGVKFNDRFVGHIDISIDKDDISKIKSAEIKLETTNKGE